MKKIKFFALVMALAVGLTTFASCAGDDVNVNNDTEKSGDEIVENNGTEENSDDTVVVSSDYDPADVIEHEDTTSLYEVLADKVTVDMVEEIDGLAYVTVDGKTYELGMDFLSMAMVYKTAVPEGSSFSSSEDIFNYWWKLYIQRWNYLAPQVPLYSNQYFDLYNAKIEGFETTPYWGAADAIVAASVKEGEANSVILGSNTDLSGAFRNSSWGKSSPASSDLDIENLTTGYSTVMTDKTGAYIWNMSALAEEPTSVLNDDGTITYTVKIKDNLVFSDGSAITAKNYIIGTLANSTAVGVAAGGSGNSGLNFVGFDAFKAYDGTGDKVYFEGVKLLDDYTFSVTIIKDYADYYYAMGYAGFSPAPLALYAGANGDIIVDEHGCCGLNDEFYAKTEKDGTEVYAVADEIVANLKWNSDLP